jgi:hypothetical protein
MCMCVYACMCVCMHACMCVRVQVGFGRVGSPRTPPTSAHKYEELTKNILNRFVAAQERIVKEIRVRSATYRRVGKALTATSLFAGMNDPLFQILLNERDSMVLKIKAESFLRSNKRSRLLLSVQTAVNTILDNVWEDVDTIISEYAAIDAELAAPGQRLDETPRKLKDDMDEFDEPTKATKVTGITETKRPFVLPPPSPARRIESSSPSRRRMVVDRQLSPVSPGPANNSGEVVPIVFPPPASAAMSPGRSQAAFAAAPAWEAAPKHKTLNEHVLSVLSVIALLQMVCVLLVLMRAMIIWSG